MRAAELSRTTAETDIRLRLELDGTGLSQVATGCGFLDHMLTLFARHGRFEGADLRRGDVHIPVQHSPTGEIHSGEDQGLVHGQQHGAVAHYAPLVAQGSGNSLYQGGAVR